MGYQEEYKSKLIDVHEAVGKINNNDHVLVGAISAEPYTFLDHFHLLKERNVENVTLTHMQPNKYYDFYEDDDYKDIVQGDYLFSSKLLRDSFKMSRASYIPNYLRNAGRDRVSYYKYNNTPVNIYVVAVSPMDSHGYFTAGSWADYHRDFVEAADMVIAEVNENAPRTFGDTYLHISEVDYIFHGDNQIYYQEMKEVEEIDRTIAKHIAGLVENGSTLQIGIGGIPNAIVSELKEKKDLGVHTEMLSDGLIELYQAGVVTNKSKSFNKDKFITAFSHGSKITYDFIHDNPNVLHLDVNKTNNPHNIARNHKMVSINTTLQVDLMGQCASEAIGTDQLSGTGGQVDTAVGAREAKDGKSIIALRSTAMIRENGNSERQRQSTIKAVHPAGTVITLTRAAVDFVVTEYGTAALRGASVKERVKALVRIAHPDYRDFLLEEARKYHLI